MRRPDDLQFPASQVYGFIRPEKRPSKRIRRRLVAAIIFGSLILILCWYGAHPVRHAIKAWHARRLARTASGSMEKDDWKKATEELQSAYQLDFTEIEVWRAIARLLWRTGQIEQSLGWWEKIEQRGQLTVSEKRDYAACALAGGELTTAEKQIDSLLARSTAREPADNLLAGQLAARRGEGAMTIAYAESTLRDSRAKPNQILSAAILILAVTAADSQSYGAAWQRIGKLAQDNADPLSLNALTFLAQHQPPAAPITHSEKNKLSLAQGATPAVAASVPAAEVANKLDHHSQARPFHHLVAMELRARAEPSHADQLLDDAVQHFRSGDDETLVALGSWLYKSGRYAALLDVLPLERALRRRDLYLQHLDALSALGRFSEVADLLSNHRFNLDEVSEHMYLAVAKKQLGQPAASANEWQRALEAAGNAETCMSLASFAERAGAMEAANSAYARATQLAPKRLAAYSALLRVLERLGKTSEAHAIAHKIVELSPHDPAAHLEETYLALLQGAPQEQIEQAEWEAEIAVLQRGSDWNARKTLGLARLRLGKPAEALAVFRHVRVNGDEPPGALAVRAAILFANGWKEEARGDAKNLVGEHLLPEEHGLLAPLVTN